MGDELFLPVPRVRQPERFGCLPACIASVLEYQGTPTCYDEIAAACLMDNKGAVRELAEQGLREAGWDVEILTSIERRTVVERLENDTPLVASFYVVDPSGRCMAHAVVICGASDVGLAVMDPLVGDYVSQPWSEVEDSFSSAFEGAYIIAGLPASAESSG